jgi:hypothetical protein
MGAGFADRRLRMIAAPEPASDRRRDVSARYHADLWRDAGTVESRREPPLATAAGNVLTFHLPRRDTPIAGLA